MDSLVFFHPRSTNNSLPVPVGSLDSPTCSVRVVLGELLVPDLDDFNAVGTDDIEGARDTFRLGQGSLWGLTALFIEAFESGSWLTL